MKHQVLQDTFERVAKTIAARTNVQVIMKGNESPRTDGKRIWLPSIPNPCPEGVERALHGTLDHETAHVLWTDFRIGTKFKAVHGERGFAVLNALEDLRIDERMAHEYPGSRENIAKSYKDCMDRWTKVAPQLPIWPRVIGCMIAIGKGWNLSIFGDDAREVVGLVEDLILQAPKAKSTKAVASLADGILERWKSAEKQRQDGKGNSQSGDAKNREEDSKSNEDAHNPEKASQRSQDGDSASESSPESPEREREAEERARESTGRSELEEKDSDQENGTNQQGEGDSAADPLQKALQTLFDAEPTDQAPSLAGHLQTQLTEISNDGSNMPYRVYSTADDVIEVAPDFGLTEYDRLMNEVRPHISVLRQKLLLTLRAKAQSRWVSDLNGNRLDRRRLHTLCLDTLTVPPFVKKGESVNQDVAFSLLIDQSGSMDGSKIRLAQQCAALLAETLDQLHVPLEVIGFTTVDDRIYLRQLPKDERRTIVEQFARFIPTRHIVYKSFRESFRKCRGRFAAIEALDYTPLNESVLLAGKRLFEHRAAKRILMVLTDGMVYLGAQQTQNTAHANLVSNVDRLKRCGIETIGIGIQTDYVNQVFEKGIVVNQIDELPKQFYELMAGLLLREVRTAA